MPVLVHDDVGVFGIVGAACSVEQRSLADLHRRKELRRVGAVERVRIDLDRIRDELPRAGSIEFSVPSGVEPSKPSCVDTASSSRSMRGFDSVSERWISISRKRSRINR